MTHPSADLARYCDGQLPDDEARAISAHLAGCERCQSERAEIEFAASVLRQVGVVRAPETLWPAIAGAAAAQSGNSRRWMSTWQLRLAAVVVMGVAVTTLLWRGRAEPAGPWKVIAQSDSGSDTSRKAVGDAIETGSGTSRIVVGTIGTVDVAPGTRLTLGEASESAFRLSLERGTISATITAPPRMFIVDTPASTVVDLGCAYTVTVSPDGTTELRMTSGWSSLEWRGTETLVPAGAMSRTRKGQRPGMPYFEDASKAFKDALNAFDAGETTPPNVHRILSEARERDTLTLWHLLSRVQGPLRAEVFGRLEAFVPLPAGVARDRVMQLDAEALRTWRLELAWHW